MGRACSTYGGEERHIHGFGEESEREDTTWKTWHNWEDNIKIDLKEVGCGGYDWIELAQDRDRRRALVNEVMNVQFP